MLAVIRVTVCLCIKMASLNVLSICKHCAWAINTSTTLNISEPFSRGTDETVWFAQGTNLGRVGVGNVISVLYLFCCVALDLV